MLSASPRTSSGRIPEPRFSTTKNRCIGFRLGLFILRFSCRFSENVEMLPGRERMVNIGAG